MKAHRSDFYYKDLIEEGVQFDLPLTQQTLDYKSLIPNWRALKYVRAYDYTLPPGMPADFLSIITPDNVVDDYNINQENVCYIAGLELQIRTRVAYQYFLLGCYVYPNVTVSGYSSWIADESPAIILYEAAAMIFKTIGYDEQNAAYRDLVTAEYAELKMSNIIANGY
jgi:hypothetical protein